MDSRFLFHASAVGVSGQFTRPVNHLIPSQAVCALAPAGGYSSARQKAFRFREILSHRGASSEAAGNRNPKTQNHETSATVTVEGLNIGNVVVLESCTARLSSVHPTDGGQAQITPQGSAFRNLQIAGRKIRLARRVDVYHKYNTLDALREYYKNDSEFRGRFLEEAFVGKEGALHEKQPKFFPWRNVQDTAELPINGKTGKTIVPLFIVLNRSAPGFHVNGNVITVENFGTIVLGQMVISGHERRITMLHAELGSPVEGSCCVGVVDGDGGNTDP
jgi:hypothetical protein